MQRSNQSVILLGLFLCLQAGCSVYPIRMVVVNDNDLEGKADISLTAPNDEPYSIEGANNKNWDYRGQINRGTQQGNRSRVKYHSSYSLSRWMVVEGRMSSGRKYPVILDTGASLALFVNDIHILENKLSIYPLKTNNDESVSWGMCRLPELSIGEVTLVNWPCFYRGQHAEVQMFGLPIARDKAVIMGLVALREFKYIVFDNVKREAEFSLEEVFKPRNSDLWTQYSFVIEEDLGGNAFLFVKIPIAGEEIELQLDTGSGRGLAITEELWKRMRKKIRNVKLRKGRDLYPYIGWLACRRGVITELKVGGRTIKNAKISIFPNDSPLVEQCDGLLGMQFFQDTTMVLDFERNLMWVKILRRS
ncbi:MAG TPA: hypothetical protein ENH34_05185 [Phycisphaerales bacterium]|nr:hypothetical protein [Phycisphaerales bacterium]